MRGRYVALSVFALGVGLTSGIALERFHLSGPTDSTSDGNPPLYWVAPMDPNFRRGVPGKSPMGMDLVPVYAGDEPGDSSEVKLSPAEVNAIGVRTAVARVETISERIETVGIVSYDEHATSHIHMRVEGWIEDLKVRAVGDRVAKGDLLFELYTPEIRVASADYLQSLRFGSATEFEIAERQLLNFGVSTAQIKDLKQSKKPVQTLQVFAPQNGVVIALAGADGMYLDAATRAMSLADLSTVWLILDVFERDIAKLTKDMTAIARFEHLPDQTFEGTIDYIYPELDAETRTLPVRLRFDNREGQLKPNMFATVSLVPKEGRVALTIPSEAVIRTGRAERVILKTGDGTFRPRFVTTGLRDSFDEGGRAEIVQGLEPGAEIVASAQFLIDSETALNAGLLRFAPTEGEPAWGKGKLVALDRSRRQAVIDHEPITSLDWPALETSFALRSNVTFDRLEIGDEVEFAAARGADGLLALTELKPDDGIDAIGVAVLHGVTEDGKLSLSHEPIPELGWPAMTMDLQVQGFDPRSVPLEEQVEIALAMAEDGLFAVVEVRHADDKMEATAAPVEVVESTLIVVDGVVEAIDLEARMANITHGPIKEIGMPGMTMDFAIADELDLQSVQLGTKAKLTLEQRADMSMLLVAVEPAAPPIEVAGTINNVDAETRIANITHGPIKEIGMPGMTMDFAIADSVEPSTLPIDRKLSLTLEKAPDLSLVLIATEKLATNASAKVQPRQVAGHWVQLGAMSNEGAARRYWSDLKSRYATTLEQQQARYFGPDDVGGNLHHVRLGPMERASAVALCRKLQAKSVDCFVSGPILDENNTGRVLTQ